MFLQISTLSIKALLFICTFLCLDICLFFCLNRIWHHFSKKKSKESRNYALPSISYSVYDNIYSQHGKLLSECARSLCFQCSNCGYCSHSAERSKKTASTVKATRLCRKANCDSKMMKTVMESGSWSRVTRFGNIKNAYGNQ